MLISNDLMESFEWKSEDWGENWSPILSKSKQALTEIGILHNFANFRQRKGSQGETRRANSDRFLGHNLAQKGSLCDLCHNRKTNWLFFMALQCIKVLLMTSLTLLSRIVNQLTIFVLDLKFAGFFYCNTSNIDPWCNMTIFAGVYCVAINLNFACQHMARRFT